MEKMKLKSIDDIRGLEDDAIKALGQTVVNVFENIKEAEAKALDALARYKFQMFGYWAAIWVHMNHVLNGGFPNPFTDLVKLARKLVEEKTGVPLNPGEEYDLPFEGIVDIKRVMAERDDALELYHKTETLNVEQEKIIDQFRHLLKVLAGELVKCRGCPAMVYWVKNPKTGKNLPITQDGLNHFADCPAANKFREGGKK